jgi:hypothetical protein
MSLVLTSWDVLILRRIETCLEVQIDLQVALQTSPVELGLHSLDWPEDIGHHWTPPVDRYIYQVTPTYNVHI